MAQSIAELLVNVGVKVKDADKAERDVKGLSKQTDKLGKSAGKTGGRLKKMGGALKTMAKGAGLAAAAVAGIGIALFKFVDAQTQALDATAKMSRALGISAEEMQRLNFAFSQSGVSASAGQKAILKLNEQVLKLSQGEVSRSSKAFEELGVQFEDLKGKTATQQLGIISDALLQVDDLSRRSALSATLLGKSAGPELATLIAEGSAGIDALAASTENVLTGEQLQRAELFQDAMGRMDQFMTGLAQTIAVELAPPITEIIDTVRQWVGANREIIDSGVDTFLSILGQIFSNVWNEAKILIAIFRPLVELVAAIAKRVDEATGALSFFKTIITGILTPITTLTKLIKKLLEGLEKLSIVSEGTAARFEASVNNMVNSSAGFDTIGQRADDAGAAIRDMSAEIADATKKFGTKGLPKGLIREGATFNLTSEEATGRRAAAAAREARRGKKPKGGGGGGKPKKPAKDKPKEPVAPLGVSLEQLDRELFSGNIENVAEQIRNLSVPGSVAAAEPQVAIEFQEFNIGPINVQATGTNNEIGDAVGARIRREFDKKIAETAQRMKSKVKA